MIDRVRAIVLEVLATRGAPIVVAIDGPSGAGKSTFASALAGELPAVVVPSDDFFAAELTRNDWDVRTTVERARDAIDWQRLRRDAIEPLRARRVASWHPFDFEAGERPDGSYGVAARIERREPADVILLEGAYMARPELEDLIDLRVLVDAPRAIRRVRLAAREPAAFLAAWHERWDGAEEYYFHHVCPASSFDVVVDTQSATAHDRRGR